MAEEINIRKRKIEEDEENYEDDFFNNYVNTKIYPTISLSEEKRIEVFKQTYNACYIRDFEPKKIDLVKSEVKNEILEALIDNIKPKTPMPDYVIGPTHFYKIIKEDEGKTFYLFGETHEKTLKHSCHYVGKKMQFQNYIERLMTESPSFFDFYVELSMIREKKI